MTVALTVPEFTPTTLPRGRGRIVDLRTLVFWVSAVAAVWCGLGLFNEITAIPTMQVLPAVGWMALVAWAMYGAAFFALVLHFQLFVRRPATVLFGALLWGGVVSTYFAAKANQALQGILVQWLGADFDERWLTALSAPINEESLKTLGVIALFLLPLAGLRNTLDGIFYGAILGLGFQIVEDFLYTVQQATDLTGVIEFVIQRGFFSGLFSHAMYSAVAGAGIGYAFTRLDRSLGRRVGVAFAAFVIAWGVHTLWDAPIFEDLFGNGDGVLLLTILVKGIPAVVALVVIFRLAARHDGTEWATVVTQSVDPDLVSADDAEVLRSRSGRRHAQHAARRAGSHRAKKICAEMQEAQLRYVQSVGEEGADSEAATRWADRIRALKALSPAAV